MVRWLRLLLIAVAIPLGMMVACQSQLIYFPRPYGTGTTAKWQERTAGKPIDFTTSQGRQRAFLQGNLKSPRNLWIVCGGNGTIALDWSDWLADNAPREDAWLLVDFPGYGDCEGAPSPGRIRESLKAGVPLALHEIGWQVVRIEYACRPRSPTLKHSGPPSSQWPLEGARRARAHSPSGVSHPGKRPAIEHRPYMQTQHSSRTGPGEQEGDLCRDFVQLDQVLLLDRNVRSLHAHATPAVKYADPDPDRAETALQPHRQAHARGWARSMGVARRAVGRAAPEPQHPDLRANAPLRREGCRGTQPQCDSRNAPHGDLP
jgi:hypothetical protein